MNQPMKRDTETKDNANAAKGGQQASPQKAHSKPDKEIHIGAPDIEDEIQLERREAYLEVETQRLLRELLRIEPQEEIIPSYDPAKGFVYESVEPIFEETTDSKKVARFLERLTKLDILKKTFFDSVSACPNCESTALTLHTSCPKCKSHHISKTSLTEHIPCGYIGEREKYIDGLCPKCNRSLDETPYADMGRWYICKECGEKFEHPQFDVVCRSCETVFQSEEANLKEISKYSLNAQRKKEVRQNVASLDSISRLLTDLNFEIQTPGWAIGEKSGMRHQFSLLATKEIAGRQKLIALDMVVGENEVQASPLILYIYKTSEVTVDLPIFVAFPKLSDTARKIVKGHNILIIEGSSEEHDRIAQIKSEIESRLSPETVSQLGTKASDTSAVESKKTPHLSTTQSLKLETARGRAPIMGAIRKLTRAKNIEHTVTVETPSEETQLRNIVFLLDGSSSMREGKRELSSFELATRAIENVLTNPDPVAKDDMLSVIIFWDEILRGFQKEILYENVSMSTYINPQKLNQFGKPKKNVGTPLWDAIKYANDFLQAKKGKKIIKLITDAVEIPQLKHSERISEIQNKLTQLDFILIGSEGKTALREATGDASLGRLFEASDVESLTLALNA